MTRDSIIKLAREWGIIVCEKPISMGSIEKAVDENRVIEMFGSGTAAIVSPIKQIKYVDRLLDIPLDPSKKSSQAGALTAKLAETIMGIQYGEIPHKWSILVE